MHRIKSKILREIKVFIRPELHDRVNVIGFSVSAVGGLLMLSTLVYDADPIVPVLALCMWSAGIIILLMHSRHG